MKLKAIRSQDGIWVEGSIHDDSILDVLESFDNDIDLSEGIEELLILGARVRSAVLASSTAAMLERSVDKVSSELDSLGKEHADFISDLMKKLLSLDKHDEEARKVSIALKIAAIEGDLKTAFLDGNDELSVLNQIKREIKSYLDKRESSVASLLSLVKPEPPSLPSPLYMLSEKLDSIKSHLGIREATDSLRQKASSKGLKFENVVFDILQEICDEYGDSADNPGPLKVNGASNNHEGDLVVDFDSLGSESGRLVIECKKFDKKQSKNSLLLELDKGIANREADYGILVTTEASYGIGDRHPFWEALDNRRAVLVLNNEDDGIEPDRIRFAVLIAKSRIRALKASLDEATGLLVGQKVKLLQDHFSRISVLKGSLSELRGNLDNADGHLTYLSEYVGKELIELAQLLR